MIRVCEILTACKPGSTASTLHDRCADVFCSVSNAGGQMDMVMISLGRVPSETEQGPVDDV